LHTAVMVVLGFVGIFLIIRLRELLIMLLIAGVMAFILRRLAERLARKMPWPAAVALVYLGLAAFFVLVATLIVPRMIEQARALIQNLPNYSERLRSIADRAATLYGGAPAELR